MIKSLIVCATTLLLFICQQLWAQPNFEFRGVWIASVENIDWPSKKGLSVTEQKAEFVRILDMHQHNGMNAMMVQVRPTADAFYPSSSEPWSEYLTGKQGLPPTPYYDPMEFMIAETHKRGMEFHAWVNPYRAMFNIHKSSIAPTHITRLHPEWFLNYGNTKYFNPGLPEVREHVNRVIRDMVHRYDIDAIHMDDYFYPYRIPGKDFPDEKAYINNSRGLKKEEWRRSNCDSIIKQLSATIRNTNPRVKFGISPFGVWRNKSKDPMGSETKAGQTNYDDLYADILLWMQQGWIDYVTPQLYWERGHALCDYDVLLDWWNEHTYGKHLFIGHGIYRAVESKSGGWKRKTELPEQIQLLRKYKTTQGSVYFSSKSFDRNPNGWCDSLRNNYYRNPALVPPVYWIDSVPPEKPVVQEKNKTTAKLVYNGKEPIKGFAVYVVAKGKELSLINAQLVKILVADKEADLNIYDVNAGALKEYTIIVASIDRNNNVSEWVEVQEMEKPI